jgi:hypothetical protein
MVALSLVRLAFILYGLLEQKCPHVHIIYTDFAIMQRKFNDTNSFHYFHKNP